MGGSVTDHGQESDVRVCTEGPRWSSGRAPVLQHRTRRWLLYRRLRAIHGRVVGLLVAATIGSLYYRKSRGIYKIDVVKAVILARFDGC